jgi:tetratricopeptide (TPR) repeat protein
VLKQVRRIYHAMVAEWLQTQAAGRSGELTGLIADHLEHAGKTTHALAYWRKAAQEAETSYANREAINYYTHALALVPENDLETSCDVLLKREDLYNKIGDSSARAADLNILTEIRDALTAAGKASEGVLCAEITYRLALFILTQGNFAKAEVEAQKAVDLARAAEVPGVVVKAYLVWSAILYRQGDYPAGKAKAEEALQFARQIEDYKGQSQALNTMGVLAMEQVELETAKGYLQESLQLSIKLADRRLECITRANLAMLAGNMGDFSAAHDQYLEVINRYREIGDRSGEGNALGNLGWLMGMLGDYAAAYAYAETNRKIFQEVEDPLNETVGLINLSSFARLQGNLQLATQHAKQALEQAHRIALSNWEAWALTVLGHAHFEEDQYTKAWHDYQRALEIRNRLAQPYLAMEPMAGLLRIALVEENLPGARELIRQILDYLDHGGTLEGADEPMRVYLTCFQALEDLQDPRAGEILDIALKRLHQQADRIVGEESRRSYLENIPWHREILEASKRQVGAE